MQFRCSFLQCLHAFLFKMQRSQIPMGENINLVAIFGSVIFRPAGEANCFKVPILKVMHLHHHSWWSHNSEFGTNFSLDYLLCYSLSE